LTLKLYDLAGRDPEHRFSPFCWRSRLALAHKGVSVDTIPWRFTEKAAIAFSGQGKVPVLVDGETSVFDSTRIADYLEARFPDRPSLFGGPEARALTSFILAWTDMSFIPALVRCYVSDIVRHLDEGDVSYFRESREARFGMPLETVAGDRDARLPALRQLLTPMRATLGQQPYLGGTTPLYADYIAFGPFQWARTVSAFDILEPDDPIWAWRERLLDAHDGMARRAPCYS
jgi:glutathione S-transferase